jgi:transcription-repair coupling factor (superfamily II helicase)
MDSGKQLEDVKAEIEDRYGPPPQAVRNLEEYAALRLMCRRLGVVSIDRRREQITIKFGDHAQVDPQRLAKFVASNKGAQFSPNGLLKFNRHATEPGQVLTALRQVLASLAEEKTLAPAD